MQVSPIEFASIDWDGRAVDIEYRWVGVSDASLPLMVFLHEGLGSLSMWKDFPEQLCQAAGCRGLVYSRPGYGQSTPRATDEHWDVDFMHRQAYSVLPAFLTALQINMNNPPWLFGHSDGGSIALLYAAAYPKRVSGLVLLSPHIMVEDLSVESIELARRSYLETDLKQKLGRYHDDPDSAFWGWNDIWLKPAFRDWSIENEIAGISCPLLALQGLDDEYGTLEQIYGIARRITQSGIVELAGCGHSPHRDQPQQLIAMTARFLKDAMADSDADQAGFCAQY
jgi:pimeloyl-ACP methyl ester carboxylesterase